MEQSKENRFFFYAFIFFDLNLPLTQKLVI
jgi:hypothetical protein